jgi:hypothetical protein
MTRRDALMAVAARVEALTGPCRETDAEIAVAALGWITRPPRYDGDDISYGYVNKGLLVLPGNGAGNCLVPEFTASLDAAMTLAKGRQVRLLISEDGIASALVGDNASTAATPALALTAAALRAIAAQEQTND